MAETATSEIRVRQKVSLQTVEATSQNAKKKLEAVAGSQLVKLRFFALLIGINIYEHAGSGFPNLKGAVADVEDMHDFLVSTLSVDRDHVRTLRDQQATRKGIIDAFGALALDERIKPGDPIVIFYAGHGAQTAAPNGWETGGRDGLIEMIIPHDFYPATCTEEHKQGILDITLAKLLQQLAEQKGDNIVRDPLHISNPVTNRIPNQTLILDSCHSASANRDALGPGVLSRGIELPDDYTILPLADDEGHRHTKVAPGFELAGLASHVLLAACSRTESAHEEKGRGAFTKELLRFLRDTNVRNVTYREVIEQLEDLPRQQHPQCEGRSVDRVLFGGKALDRSWYPVKVTQITGQDDTITLGGGDVHNVTGGDEFDVFATRDFSARPLCRLVVSATFACSAVLVAVPGPAKPHLPQLACALPATPEKRADFKVALDKHAFHHVCEFANTHKRPNKRAVAFVDTVVPHKVEIAKPHDVGTVVPPHEVETAVPGELETAVPREPELKLQVDNDRAVFVVTDRICTSLGLEQYALPRTVSMKDAASIYTILEAAADFFFHLRRSNAKAPLEKKIFLQAFELEDRYDEKEGRFNIIPSSDNLVKGGVVQLEITKESKMYGFKLVSGWPHDLFVWVFIFDMSDLAVETLCRPTFAKNRPDASLPARGWMPLGYGAGGVQPREFFLPEGTKVDVSYVKVYVTSEYVDLSYIAQKSPFEPGAQRKMGERAVAQPDVWDTVTIAIVQKAAK